MLILCYFLNLNLFQSVLLLTLLTKSNANIQKILAFENAFDRLFDVIQEEGSVDGGIVVQDCLNFMLTLLRNNISTQNFFKEGLLFFINNNLLITLMNRVVFI